MSTETTAAPGLDRRFLEGIVALVVVQFVFGLFPLFVKITTNPAAGGFAPRALVAWRIIVGALVLFTLACLRHGRGVLLNRKELKSIALLALLGVVFNQVLATEGVYRTQVTKAGVLMCLIPVFTYAFALFMGQERFSPRRAVGIGIALAGAATLVLSRGEVPELRMQELLGDGMIVANCAFFALFLVLAKPLLDTRPSLVVIAWIYVASLWTVPFVAWNVELFPSAPASSVLWGLAYTLILSTVIAYILNTFALARVSASTTASFIYLQPLIAGAAGYWVRGERLGEAALIAVALLFVGLGLVIRRAGR